MLRSNTSMRPDHILEPEDYSTHSDAQAVGEIVVLPEQPEIGEGAACPAALLAEPELEDLGPAEMPTGPKHGDVGSIVFCGKCGTPKIVVSSKQNADSHLCAPCYCLNIEKKVCEARVQRVGAGASLSGASTSVDAILDVKADISKKVKAWKRLLPQTSPTLTEPYSFA